MNDNLLNSLSDEVRIRVQLSDGSLLKLRLGSADGDISCDLTGTGDDARYFDRSAADLQHQIELRPNEQISDGLSPSGVCPTCLGLTY